MTYQKQENLTLKTKAELHSVPVPTAVMNQIRVAICNLTEVDRYSCLIVCTDYFSKWSEAKPLKDKKRTTVSQFLYELMCRHACFSIQIKIKIDSSSVVFLPNCIVLLAPFNV